MLTVGLVGSRYLLDEARQNVVWAAFLDAMHALRLWLEEPPPYRFLAAEFSSVDRYLSDRLAAAGRDVGTVHPPPGVETGYALWSTFQRLSSCDGLVAIWDARVHEPLLPLHLAHSNGRPFEVRVLAQPSPAAFLDPPWTAVSSTAIYTVAEIPQPRRRLTPEEREGLSYDLEDPRGITYRHDRLHDLPVIAVRMVGMGTASGRAAPSRQRACRLLAFPVVPGLRPLRRPSNETLSGRASDADRQWPSSA